MKIYSPEENYIPRVELKMSAKYGNNYHFLGQKAFRRGINLHYATNCSFHRNNANSKHISKSIRNNSSIVIQANHIDYLGRGLGFFPRIVTLTRKILAMRCDARAGLGIWNFIARTCNC